MVTKRECLLPFISKMLGYLIFALSTTIKLPQIFEILRHNSVRGLNVAAYELEIVGYAIALGYGLYKGITFQST